MFFASSAENKCDLTSSAVFNPKLPEMKMPFEGSCAPGDCCVGPAGFGVVDVAGALPFVWALGRLVTGAVIPFAVKAAVGAFAPCVGTD